MVRLFSMATNRSAGFFNPRSLAPPRLAKAPICPSIEFNADCFCWGGRIVVVAVYILGSRNDDDRRQQRRRNRDLQDPLLFPRQYQQKLDHVSFLPARGFGLRR